MNLLSTLFIAPLSEPLPPNGYGSGKLDQMLELGQRLVLFLIIGIFRVLS